MKVELTSPLPVTMTRGLLVGSGALLHWKQGSPSEAKARPKSWCLEGLSDPCGSGVGTAVPPVDQGETPGRAQWQAGQWNLGPSVTSSGSRDLRDEVPGSEEGESSTKDPCTPLPLFPEKRFPSLTHTRLLTQIQAPNCTGPVENENVGLPVKK